jgi:hypothetical protein
MCIVLLSSNCQDDAIPKGIVLFKSTRADVEKALGAPTESCNLTCDYKTEVETIFVRYSDERCKSGDSNAFDVPRSTVITVKVYPTKNPSLRDLKLDSKNFTKTNDPELAGHSIYTNMELGVTYEVSDKEMILSVEWFGSAKEIKRLQCK